eukprot:603850-Amphidinium_carterae.1
MSRFLDDSSNKQPRTFSPNVAMTFFQARPEVQGDSLRQSPVCGPYLCPYQWPPQRPSLFGGLLLGFPLGSAQGPPPAPVHPDLIFETDHGRLTR